MDLFGGCMDSRACHQSGKPYSLFLVSSSSFHVSPQETVFKENTPTELDYVGSPYGHFGNQFKIYF